MDKIEEKSIDELVNKKKKFKVRAKKTIVSFLVASMLISTVPSIEYKIALIKSKNDTDISSVVENSNKNIDDICKLFENAILSNNHLSDEQKEVIIKSFTKYCIEPYGQMFTDEMIYNMCAIASTERVALMSEFSKKHSWWIGDYNPYLNIFTVHDWEDEQTIAHEQLHGVLKSEIFSTGYSRGIHGYGVNEGMTSNFSNDDSYYEQGKLCDTLGLIIGYDVLIKNYYNSNLEGLESEINKYLSQEETSKLIGIIDEYTFRDFLEIFKLKNRKTPKEEEFSEKQEEYYKEQEKYTKEQEQRLKEAYDLLKKLFESKYQVKPENCNLGRIIFGQDGVSKEEWNINEPFYLIDINDYNSVNIIVIRPQRLKNEEVEGVNTLVTVDGYEKVYTVNNDELKDFDIDGALELAKSNSKKRI